MFQNSGTRTVEGRVGKEQNRSDVPVSFQERLGGISSNMSQVSIMTGGGTDEILVVKGQRSKVKGQGQRSRVKVSEFSRYKKVQKKKKRPCKCLKEWNDEVMRFEF